MGVLAQGQQLDMHGFLYSSQQTYDTGIMSSFFPQENCGSEQSNNLRAATELANGGRRIDHHGPHLEKVLWSHTVIGERIPKSLVTGAKVSWLMPHKQASLFICCNRLGDM